MSIVRKPHCGKFRPSKFQKKPNTRTYDIWRTSDYAGMEPPLSEAKLLMYRIDKNVEDRRWVIDLTNEQLDSLYKQHILSIGEREPGHWCIEIEDVETDPPQNNA